MFEKYFTYIFEIFLEILLIFAKKKFPIRA